MKLTFRLKSFPGHKGRPGEVGGSLKRNSNAKDAILKDYLHNVSKMMTQSSESMVHTHGRSYKPQELPKGYKYGKQKECFMNAHKLVSEHDNLTYVEGFALPDFMDLPVNHAWVVDDNGNVIDNTWRKAGTSYIGIPFNTDFMYKVAVDTGVYGVLGYHSRHIFQNGMPEEAIKS